MPPIPRSQCGTMPVPLGLVLNKLFQIAQSQPLLISPPRFSSTPWSLVASRNRLSHSATANICIANCPHAVVGGRCPAPRRAGKPNIKNNTSKVARGLGAPGSTGVRLFALFFLTQKARQTRSSALLHSCLPAPQRLPAGHEMHAKFVSHWIDRLWLDISAHLAPPRLASHMRAPFKHRRLRRGYGRRAQKMPGAKRRHRGRTNRRR
jgi:hypothetical protein